MEQKIIQIKDSAGIIIPEPILKDLGLAIGNQVIIERDPFSDSITIYKKGTKKSSITPEFLRIVNNVHQEYAQAFKELAKK
jgi:bifunctional DNA-binding transcriptional regulator/antitoxin component of YhaV-PrlF toxin-antitoxin module